MGANYVTAPWSVKFTAGEDAGIIGGMPTRRSAFLAVASLCLAGCGYSVHPNVTSNKDQSYALKLQRVLVAMDLKSTTALANTPIVSSEIGNAISNKWAPFGVSVRMIELQPLDTASGVAAAMAQFHPTQVMQLSLAST